ncbi:MAG: hypothetical protein A2Y80_03820 [Deltaproteobacteria bacterium RBG_13_58_19]|nr:MAG: hypothetical protein A2Y80_03820 [Deltaproteobacteria bacterium RBG_13_58_19]
MNSSTITMSRGRHIDLGGPQYYQDLLTTIAQEILHELSEIEKIDFNALGPEGFEQVVGITQIRLLNELYFCLGQLRAKGIELDVKQAIQDLRDIWNRYIDKTNRPETLKFHEEPDEGQVQ